MHGAKSYSDALNLVKNSDYDQKIPQSQTVEKPMTPWESAVQESRDKRQLEKAR